MDDENDNDNDNEMPQATDDLDGMVIKLMQAAFEHGTAAQRFWDAQQDLLTAQQKIQQAHAAYKKFTAPPEGQRGDN